MVRIFKSVGIVLAGNLTSMFFGFLNILFLASFLGPERFGYIPTLIALSSLLLIPADFGMSSATTRYIAEGRIPVNQIISSALTMKVMVSGALVGLYMLVVFIFLNLHPLNSLETVLFLYFVPFLAFSESMFKFLIGTFQGFKEVKLMAGYMVFWRVTQFILCAGLVTLGYGVVGAAVGYGISSILIFAVGFLSFIKKYLTFPSLTHFPLLFKFSFFSFISMSMVNLMIWTDTLLIAYFRSYEEVAFYSVAMRMAFMNTSLPIAMEAIIYPLVSSMFGKNDAAGLESIVETYTRRIFYSALIPGIFIIFAGYILINFLLVEYVPALRAFYILSLSLIFGSLGILFSSVFNGINKPRVFAKITVLQAGLNLMLNILLIPHFGYVAAALSSLVTFIVGMLLGFRAIGTLLKIPITLSTFRPRREEIIFVTRVILKIFRPSNYKNFKRH